ncbi:PilZ domain-containing protein [Rhizorhapis sp. SPR117]|uniref:PilZ domain-containing protein n=1 Tax=Rhizorhapis sp. SPR117 TaxID=2912611 RepID=UPI001F46A5B3|nr:PilZ domain-containing protein [Rhizorhapis sp. SPR117]
MKAHEKTRELRTRRLLKAQIMSERLGSTSIVIRNISSGGLGAKCDDVLIKGEEVAVLLANIGAIDATVMWVRDGAFGLQFHEKIDPENALAVSTERAVKPYEVPSYFRPVITTYRPGFKRKK